MGTSSRSDSGNAGKDIFLGGADERFIDENLQGRYLARQAFQLADDPVST